MPQRFGDWVRGVRLEKGLTQAQAAIELHVTRMQFLNWEKGQSTPKARSLFRLADWAGVKVDDFRPMFS
jgi:transcriptional regulator with XRE-family HTH domain